MCRCWPSHRPTTPPLSPFRLVPTRSSSAVEPIGVLEQIDRIEINSFVDRGGVIYYILDVYRKQQLHRIPSNFRLGLERREKPDYQLEKRYSEFESLRYNVWLYAQRRHGKHCKYCEHYMDYIVTSFAQPRLATKLLIKGKRMRQKLLAKFSNAFVHLAIGGKDEPRERHLTCEGYLTIPMLVERFLREEV